MPSAGWHRVFHPLCGSDPLTLLTVLLRHGGPGRGGLARAVIAFLVVMARAPFTAAERVWFEAVARRRPVPPPIFILGHMRSGTTHLHNLLAATGHFTTVPPVIAGLPWDAFGLGRFARPFVEPYLPPDRLIDRVALRPDAPTEDEIALACMAPVSYYHAIYFPERFRESYLRGLFFDGCSERQIGRWRRRFRHYVDKMARLDPSRPLLIKNPAYTGRIGMIRAMWPEARFIHIFRDPVDLFVSSRRALRTVIAELALQDGARAPVDEVVLEAYPRQMRRFREEADRLPPGALVSVRFEELERDPVAVLAEVYRNLGLDGFADAEPRIAAYLRSIRRYRKNAEPPRPEDARAVDRHWRSVVDARGYPLPTEHLAATG